MAYGYRSYGGRGGYGRKNFSRKPYAKKSYKGSSSGWNGYANIARKALRTAQMVASIVNVEHKYIDTQVTSATILNTAYRVDPLTLCAEGDDMTNRNGRSIKATELDLRVQLQQNAAAAPVMFRMMLIRDNACSGATLTMTDIVSSTIGTNNAPNDYRNVLTGATKRYDILYNKFISLDGGDSYKNWTKHIKLDSHVRYIGTGNTITSAGQGSLFLACISTGATGGTTDGSTLTYQCRVKFVDN